MRPTSLEAYEKIKANGLLSQRRWEAFAYVCEHEPCTAWDAWKALTPDLNVSSTMGRFSELERLGVIRPAGEVVNPATGMRHTTWEVTGTLPVKVDRAERRTFWVVLDPSPTFWVRHDAFEGEQYAAEYCRKTGRKAIKVKEIG